MIEVFKNKDKPKIVPFLENCKKVHNDTTNYYGGIVKRSNTKRFCAWYF